MNCSQISLLLDAFAEEELGWGAAWRVRRHLIGCAVCTAELAEIRQLDCRVQGWNAGPAPAGLEARIAEALPRPAFPVSPRRFPVRRVAVGLAGVGAAAAVVFWLVPGQPGRPTIAFADVEQAMQQVQTVSWRTEVQGDNHLANKRDVTKMSYHNWIRCSPPAIAMTDFGPVASTIHNPIKTLLDDRGGLVLYKDECEVNPLLKGLAKQRVEKQLHGLTQFPQAEPSSVSSDQAHTSITNFTQSYVLVNGQKQARFDQDVKALWAGESKPNTFRLSHVSTWADIKTHRILRIETHVLEDTHFPGAFRTLVMDHFQYEQTPPKEVFDWSPPTGIRVVRLPSEPIEK